MDPDSPESPPVSARLVLSPPGTDPVRRRRRRIFVALYAAITLLLIWPVYPLFSLAWVVMALAMMFGALLWLFRSEPDAEPSGGER